jgi:hypothetical protein
MDSSTLRRQPVVIVFSVLAGLQVVVAGLLLIDTLNKDLVAIISLVVAAFQTMATLYVRGMVTPWDTVVSKLASDGTVVPGPAADGVAGAPPNVPKDPPEASPPGIPPVNP